MEDLEMLKTPPALKWLAEKRARVAADLAQTERLVSEGAQRLASLRLDLESLDRSIQVFDVSLAPADIEPIQGRTTYRRRGALRKFVGEQLARHAPDWVPTDTLETLVIAEFGLEFSSPAERKRWYDNSLRSALKDLVRQGKTERQQDHPICSQMAR
jgi:hypothetical protein